MIGFQIRHLIEIRFRSRTSNRPLFMVRIRNWNLNRCQRFNARPLFALAYGLPTIKFFDKTLKDFVFHLTRFQGCAIKLQTLAWFAVKKV